MAAELAHTYSINHFACMFFVWYTQAIHLFASLWVMLPVSIPIYIPKLSVFFLSVPFFQAADSWGSNMCKSWHGWHYDILTET